MLSKTHQVWRHLAAAALEDKRRRWPSLAVLAGELDLGISTVHRALAHPVEIGVVAVRPAGGIRLLDTGRLLMLWAAERRLGRDIIDRLQVAGSAPTIERLIANPKAILGGFGAVVAHTDGNRVADYETVLVYGDPQLHARQRIPDHDPSRITEVVVLEPDPLLHRYGRITPLSQAWVDLFNLPGWQAARFVHHLLPSLVSDAHEPGLLSA